MLIELETIKKIAEAYNSLNLIEVKGIGNISAIYKSLILLQESLVEIDKINQKSQNN